jgi:hypothetical protein
MDPRIHAALDDPQAADALSAPERAELEQLRASLEAAAGALRAAPFPDLTARVMAALPPAPVRAPSVGDRVRAALDWLWQPRPVRITLRPAYALAFSAAVAGVIALPDGSGPAAVPALPVAIADAPAAPAPMLVQFRLQAPGAQRVALAGTFTGWHAAVELRQTAPGEWTALVPLAPGVHDYAFVVDGERWVADPHAPQVDDDFGGTNSRLSLPPVSLQS